MFKTWRQFLEEKGWTEGSTANDPQDDATEELIKNPTLMVGQSSDPKAMQTAKQVARTAAQKKTDITIAAKAVNAANKAGIKNNN